MIRKSTDSESRLVFAKGWGEGEYRVTANRYGWGFFFGVTEFSGIR